MTDSQPFSPSPDHFHEDMRAKLAEQVTEELTRVRKVALFLVGSDDPLVFDGPSPFAILTAESPIEGFLVSPIGVIQRSQIAAMVNLDDLLQEETSDEEDEAEPWKQGSPNPFSM